MRVKTLLVSSVVLFMVGVGAGGGYTYMNHDATQNTKNDIASLMPVVSQESKEEAMLNEFVSEQEKLHPEGLTTATIATGSKYDGITYNADGTPKIQGDGISADVTVTKEAPATSTQEQKPTTETEKQTTSDMAAKKNDKAETGAYTNDGTQQVGVPTVTNAPLNLREGPATNTKVLGHLYNTDTVWVIGKTGNWYHVVTEQGVEGYASADYIKIIK